MVARPEAGRRTPRRSRRHDAIREPDRPRRLGFRLRDRRPISRDQRRERGDRGERPPGDPSRGVGADDEEEAQPQQGGPRRRPSPAGEVRRDEQRGPVEQDSRDVTQRGRLPLADQARHRGVRTELGRIDPDRWAERRQAARHSGHHRDGQREVATRRALCNVGDPGEPEHGRREEEAAVDIRPRDRDRDDEPQPPRVRPAVGRRGGASARTAPSRSAGAAAPARAPTRRTLRAQATPQCGRRCPVDGTARRSRPR